MESDKKYSRKYAFSSMLECASCGSNLSRRNWHSGKKNEKVTFKVKNIDLPHETDYWN